MDYPDDYCSKCGEEKRHCSCAAIEERDQRIATLEAELKRRVRELDALWNGEAATQAAFIDVLAQIRNELPKLRTAEAERDEMRTALEEAPHSRGCAFSKWLDHPVFEEPPCDCWKAALSKGQGEG